MQRRFAGNGGACRLCFRPGSGAGLLIPEKGTGRLIENEEARRLNAAQKRLLTDYMNACYESLAALELCDLTPLFAGHLPGECRGF